MPDRAMQPLLARCQARSGSTLLLRCLSQLDGIAIALHPPCEVRYAQYMAAAFDVMTGHADLDESSRPNFFHLDKGEKWIGRNPFNRRMTHGYHKHFGEQYKAEFREFFIRRIERFYADVARINNVSGSYFCEKVFYISRKGWEQDADEIFHLYPDGIRAIYLVRDPRDIFCSNQAFFHSGAAPDDRALEAAMRGLGRHTDAMADAYRRNRGEEKLIVRYEEMIEDPVATLGEVSAWLGLDSRRKSLENAARFGRKQKSRQHRTARSVEASVGRWQDELTEDLARHANRCFANYRKTFGYR